MRCICTNASYSLFLTFAQTSKIFYYLLIILSIKISNLIKIYIYILQLEEHVPVNVKLFTNKKKKKKKGGVGPLKECAFPLPFKGKETSPPPPPPNKFRSVILQCVSDCAFNQIVSDCAFNQITIRLKSGQSFFNVACRI